jgi:hypothetical protein
MASFESRSRRLGSRAADQNESLDVRLESAYSLVTGPPTIACDASEDIPSVLSAALEACEEFGIISQRAVEQKANQASSRNKRMSMGIYEHLPLV